MGKALPSGRPKDKPDNHTKEPAVKPKCRLLLEFRGGRLILYPVTDTDEQTRAVLDHIANALEHTA